jgi:phospholipid-translocating ATPase
VIHVLAIFASLFGFYSFSFIYNTFCKNCFGLPSTYWVIHITLGNGVYWFTTIVASVMALLPR